MFEQKMKEKMDTKIQEIERKIAMLKNFSNFIKPKD